MKQTQTSHWVRIVRAAVLAIALIGLGAALGFCAEPESQANSGWERSYPTALQVGKKTQRPVMLVFTGSDWCHWCKKLDDEVLMNQEFVDWTKKNVVKVKVDFPRTMQLPAAVVAHNDALLNHYRSYVEGYPTILVVDEMGAVISKHGYVHDLNQWITTTNQAIMRSKTAGLLSSKTGSRNN